jgi:hypothetical protein
VLSRGVDDVLFDARSAAGGITHQTIHFTASSDALRVRMWNGSSHSYQLFTTQVFRDPSAWYHVVVAFDSTQATDTNRVKIYVNGVQVSSFSTASYPSQNLDGYVNDTGLHNLGTYGYTSTNRFDGYLADIHFIDGQALAPTSFGEFDDNGIWQPKAYTGTYGTNGFHLDFADNSSNTATTLGKDTSGNGNNWTPNNLSVTAGAGNDSLVDVPTNGAETDTGVGGEVRGNYCTWNPLYRGNVITSGTSTLSNGNLVASAPSNGNDETSGTIGVSSGKWYFELTNVSGGNNTDGVGIADLAGQAEAIYRDDGNFRYDGSEASYGASWQTSGDVIGVKIDLDNSTIGFYKNGVYQGDAKTDLPAAVYHPLVYNRAGAPAASELVVNFGQRAFAYTAPSGFKALNTANLPAPLVTKPSTVMDVKLYTGNGGTQTISGLEFSPDFIWIKSRSAAYDHQLADVVRGVGNILHSNLTAAESTLNTITGTTSDGFTVSAASFIGTNANSQTFAAWTWDAGSSTVTNTQGSISSQVRVNTSAGFSIVKFNTGTSSPFTVGHGLGVKPALIIDKATGNVGTWSVYHSALGATKFLRLNTTDAANTQAYPWNNTEPTSTVFTGGDFGWWGASFDHIAYCFAPVAGYSSFGSYTGNGSADGPFVYTGFRPRWILIKNTSATGFWILKDTARDPGNTMAYHLAPNASDADYYDLSLLALDSVSNGFKVRNNNSGHNTNGNVYVYAAFAEHPFQYSRAR